MTLAEIRKKIADLRAKRSKLIADATALIANSTLTSADRATADSHMTEARQLASDITLLDEAERADGEERSRAEAEEARARQGRPPLPAPGTTQDGSEQQRAADQAQRQERGRQHEAALRNYLANGDPSELRALGVAAGSTGGYTVPVTTMAEIDTAILSYGGVAPSLRQLVTASGELIDWPTMNDTSSSGQEAPENAAQTEQDFGFGTVALSVGQYGSGIVQVPRTLFQDSLFNIAQLVNDNLSERLGRRLANKLMGVGAADANFDILPSVVAAGPTSASGTAISLPDVSNLYAAVDPAYAKKFVMSRATQVYLASLRNGLGAPIFPLDQNGMLTNIFGLDIVVDLQMPGVAINNRALLLGDLNKYILRRVGGIEIQRLNERYAEFGQVGFIGWMRAGGRYIDAGTHPIKALVQAAS